MPPLQRNHRGRGKSPDGVAELLDIAWQAMKSQWPDLVDATIGAPDATPSDRD